MHAGAQVVVLSAFDPSAAGASSSSTYRVGGPGEFDQLDPKARKAQAAAAAAAEAKAKAAKAKASAAAAAAAKRGGKERKQVRG